MNRRLAHRVSAAAAAAALLGLAACGGTSAGGAEHEPSTTSSSVVPAPVVAGGSTTTSGATPRADDMPAEIVLTARQVWSVPLVSIDPGPVLIRNDMNTEVLVEVNEGALGEWVLASGESVIVDLSELPRARYRIRAMIGVARTSMLVDTELPTEEVEITPEDYVVDLSPVTLSVQSVGSLTWLYVTSPNAWQVRWDADLLAPTDWVRIDTEWTRTFGSETDRTWMSVGIVEPDFQLSPLVEQFDVTRSGTGIEWALFSEADEEYPGLVGFHAFAVVDDPGDEIGAVGVRLLMVTAEGEADHLLDEVFWPAVDSFDFTRLEANDRG